MTPQLRRAIVAWALCSLGLGACQEDPTAADPPRPDATVPDAMAEADTTPEPTPEPQPQPEPEPGLDLGVEVDMDPSPVDCAPALGFDPPRAYSAVYDLVVLNPVGGTGDYRFELIEDNSGGLVNEVTGAYLAGSISGVSDTVRMTDAGCIGEATIEITVVEPLEIRPRQLEVAPEQVIRFDATGGSGRVEYQLRVNNTRAQITPDGVYTAGFDLGRDVVEIVDPQSGLIDQAVVNVVESPSITADPARLFMPVGATVPITFEGGSGVFEVERSGRSANFDPETNTMSGLSPGRTTVTLTDRYTRQVLEYAVDVSAPLEAELSRSGLNMTGSTVHGPGDLDGDGFADAIVGHPEPSINAFAAGAVFVYRGGPDGLLPEPAQIFAGRAREDELGRAVTTADLDGDGQRDLLIGAWRDDSDGRDRGAIYMYRGVEGGLFEETPFKTLIGLRNDDRMGLSLAVCDFNGDGFVDLATGATEFDDRAGQAVNNTGAVLVFLGTDEGFLDEPDGGVATGGGLNEGGDWLPQTNRRIGLHVAAGDVDGDGLCDLVTSTLSNGTGAVYVYRGRAVGNLDENDRGGIDLIPSRVYVGSAGSNLGRRLAVADLDGDRRADVIATDHVHDEEGLRDVGAIKVFSGGPLAGPVRQVTPAAEASWIWRGDSANDNAGLGLAVGDWTGNGLPDLIVGNWADEAVEAPLVDSGSVMVLPGRPGEWPSDEARLVVYGEVAGDRFGAAVALLGDVDGDGVFDLGVNAARDGTFGINVGQPYFVSGADGALLGLDLPGGAAGARNGWSVSAVGDVDGDGRSDLVVGAVHTSLPPNNLRAGSAFLYRGVDGGYDTTPAAIFRDHFGHSGSDQFGYDVASGDFDGDGTPDVFISAVSEERPNQLDPAQFAVDGECPAGNDAGVVYIYRGRDGGPDATRPDYVYVGPRAGATMRALLVVDINDDDLDDLIVGGPSWDVPGVNGRDHGGVQVLYGRPPDPEGRIRVLCDPAFEWSARLNQGNTGRDLAAVGDIDDDGCTDIAFGSHLANIDRSPEPGDETPRGGATHILFGWNAEDCAGQPRMLSFAGAGNQPQAGFSVAGGDVIGDRAPDLVVGAINHVDRNNVRTGAVYIIDGAWIASLETDSPDRLLPNYRPLGPPGEQVVLYGTGQNAERFGASIEVVGGRVFIGFTGGVVGQQAGVGGATVFGFRDGAPFKVAALIGETWKPGGLIGSTLTSDPDRPLVAIGGYQASGLTTDGGAVYVYNLSGLR